VIAHLGEAEDPLDDPDRMLELCPHLRMRMASSRTRPSEPELFDYFLIAYGGQGILSENGKLHLDDAKVKRQSAGR
jgi:hypothetical protein